MTKVKITEVQKQAMCELGGGEFWSTFHEIQAKKDTLDSLVDTGIVECSGEQYRLTEEGIERRYNIVYLDYLEEERLEEEKKANRPFDETAKPIHEVIDEIMADVPPEEFDKLPKDGASEHDHYLYGTPKKGKNA